MLTPRQAVEIATADNENWMMTARGIVDFILSECSLENVGNDEYDNVILQNPAESRRIADEFDRQMDEIQEQTLYPTPEENFWDDRTTPLAYSRTDSERDLDARRKER